MFDDKKQLLITHEKTYTYRYVVDTLECMELLLECLSHGLAVSCHITTYEIRDYVGRPLFYDMSLYGVLFLARSHGWKKAE